MSGFDEERLSLKSDNSERRIKINKKNDFVENFTIERPVEVNNTSNRRHTSSKYGTENLFDNKKPLDNANSINHFGKKEDRKRYDQNEYSHKNGESPSSSNPNRFGSKSNKSSVRQHKQYVPKSPNSASSNDENWNSPESSLLNNSKSNLETLNTSKIETASVVSQNIKKNVPKPEKSKNKFSLETIELPRDQFTEVHVEHAINESVGWVTVTNKATEFENFTLSIYEIIENAPLCTPEIDKLVLALYEELWFRAIILSVSPDIKVRYIDYGNEKVVSKADIKEIPSHLATKPAFAICIKLANDAPCKMVNDTKIKVKPVEKENNLVVVHVENGVYDTDTKKSSEQIDNHDHHLLDKFHKLLISQMNASNTGFLEMTIRLSKSKFIASFMPYHLTEDAAKLQNINPPVNPSFKANVGDIVCAENEEGWQRAYLLKIQKDGSIKVAFIDFGTIADVPEVRSLPNEFINIPIFSCLCYSINDEDLSEVSSADFQMTNITGNNMSCTIKLCEKEIEFDIVCSPWDPRIDIDIGIDVCVPEARTTFTQLPEIILKNGDSVKLEMENDGFLYVRNKQASNTRKKIDDFMAKYGSKAPTITDKPYVGQLITAEFEGDFYRAIIKSINNNDVIICYIDYGNEETVPLFSLKTLHEEMLKEPISIIKIQLKHFINKPFDVKALEYLENLATKKTLLKAIFNESPEGGYELKTLNGLCISEELEKLNVKKQERNENVKTIKIPNDNDPKIVMNDLPLEEIPLGETKVVFQQFSDIDDNILCVCVSDPKILNKVNVQLQNEISQYVHNMLPNASSSSSYEPIIEECVLVQNEGKWYRGACTSEAEPETGSDAESGGQGNNKYTIFLVDYGSCYQFSSKNIRRMPKEFAKESALCNFAKFDGLPDNASPNLRKRLKSLLERNNSYPVNVLEKIEEDECYIIQFPTILEKLKEEKILF